MADLGLGEPQPPPERDPLARGERGPAASASANAPGGVDPSRWHGRRVLVTGHTGFKGAWLSLWLQQLGAAVTGLSRGVPSEPSPTRASAYSEGMAESVEADIRDARSVERAVRDADPEVVFHLAAQPLVRRSYERPRETYEVNVIGTANVLDAIRAAGATARAVVVVTSDKCYENDGSGRAYREDDRLGGADPYSSSKACQELLAAAYRRSFFADPDGPRVATARAGNVIGGGDFAPERLLPDAMRAALAGEPLRVRNPEHVRPWQHVLNPLTGYLLLADRLLRDAGAAGAWNFGPGDDGAWPVARVLARVAELLPGGLRWEADEQPGPREAQRLRIDSARAREQLGWRPPLTLEDALASTVGWFAGMREGLDLQALTGAQIAALTPR